MSHRIDRSSPGVGSQIGAAVLLIITFALIGFVALSVVTGNDFGFDAAAQPNNIPLEALSPETPVGTPNPLAQVNFKDMALGFSLKYPQNWRKKETALRVVLSPSAGGLDPDNLQDAALWIGIPFDGTTEPAELMGIAQAMLPTAGLHVSNLGTQRIGNELWQSAQLNVEHEQLGPMTALIAVTSKNEVGYYLVALAPSNQWSQYQPAFNSIFSSFNFTTEAVLRPTDATPPPTPTPTPTPVFHIVVSGDTLSHISVKYGVTIEAIMTRNGLTENSIIRPGDKLIIPRKRQR